MTAIASPRGRSPPRRPSPPRKPMLEEHRKGRRGACSCLGPSCFGGSPVADSDAGRLVDRRRAAPSWLTWSRFRKQKKKTVPVDSSAAELIPEKIIRGDDDPPLAGGGDEGARKGRGQGAKEEEQAGKQNRRRMSPTKGLPLPPSAAELPSQSFLWRFWKGNKGSGGSKIQFPGSQEDHVSVSKHTRQQLPQQQLRLATISPKYDTRRAALGPYQPEPARAAPSRPRTPRTAPTPAAGCSLSPFSTTASPVHSKPPPHHTATTSRLGGARSHKKSEEPSSSSSSVLSAGKNDQLLGLSVMAVVLVMMVLFGRASAVVFTCLWFYCLPRLRATIAESNGGGRGSKSSAKVDFDSEEYKKKVVLEGLLQRNGRRPPGSS